MKHIHGNTQSLQVLINLSNKNTADTKIIKQLTNAMHRLLPKSADILTVS